VPLNLPGELRNTLLRNLVVHEEIITSLQPLEYREKKEPARKGGEPRRLKNADSPYTTIVYAQGYIGGNCFQFTENMVPDGYE
jgi:hypothetical protein